MVSVAEVARQLDRPARRDRSSIGFAALALAGTALVALSLGRGESVSAEALHGAFLAVSILCIVLLGEAGHRVHPPVGGRMAARLLRWFVGWLVWRISLFPLVVITGSLLCWFDARFPLLDAPAFYTAFLLLFLALLAGCTRLALRLVRRPRSALALLALPAASLAVCVSFVHRDDWSPSPVDTARLTDEPVLPTMPLENPYAARLASGSPPFAERVLLSTASVTYSLVPAGSPWAQAVKGTLERSVSAGGEVGSRRFLSDHYRAFGAAHRLLGARSSRAP